MLYGNLTLQVMLAAHQQIDIQKARMFIILYFLYIYCFMYILYVNFLIEI